MANISYNGTIGSVDIGHEDLEVSSVPLQPTPLLYACSFDHRELSSDFLDNIHSTNFLAHHPRPPTFHSQDQLRLRLVPSPLEENSILNHQWQALPSYPDMGPVVANGQQVVCLPPLECICNPLGMLTVILAV
jgi:hypothetical protein